MSQYLLNRPIAVLISTLALILFGVIAWMQLPISLIPSADVPVIKISVYYPNSSPEVIEEEVLSVIRESMLTTQGFKDIHSTAFNESGTIDIHFQAGTRMNLTYLEVNERIDRIIDELPDDLKRPLVSRVSSSDIPIIQVNLVPEDPATLPDLTRLVENVIKKRFEQLKGISVVDMNGAQYPEILISPHLDKLTAYQLSLSDIQESLRNNNKDIGGLVIKDGQYQYYLRLENKFKNIEDIKNQPLYINHGIVQLQDVAEVKMVLQETSGSYEVNGKPALAIVIYKQDQARLTSVVQHLNNTLDQLKLDYPAIDFSTSRNQFGLLQAGISNLASSLLFGGVFAFLILFVFMGDFRLPLIMGLTIPITVIISFLLFQLTGLSINIITLSGLALGVGMLIDNSIIMLDNISRRHEESGNKSDSCVKGALEVAGPMISSVLTTLAVFVPLIFLGGVAGTLFKDQALAISIVLCVSLAVSFILLPVAYNLFIIKSGQYDSELFRIIMKFYQRGFQIMINHKILVGIIFLILIPVAVIVGVGSHLEGTPDLKEKNLLLRLEWGEPISHKESLRRIRQIVKDIGKGASHSESVTGLTQFTFNSGNRSLQHAEVYMEFPSVEEKIESMTLLEGTIRTSYPNLFYTIASLENPITQLLNNDQPYWQVRWRQMNQLREESKIDEIIADFPLSHVSMGSELIKQPYYEIHINTNKARTLSVSLSSIHGAIQNAFDDQEIMDLNDGVSIIPVINKRNEAGISDVIRRTWVSNDKEITYPLSEFIKVNIKESFKEIRADESGPYFSFHAENIPDDSSTKKIYEWSSDKDIQISLSGRFDEDRENLGKLIVILAISVLLLYFILAAQFESFTQPFIIMVSLPMGVLGSLLLLRLTGNSLNLMSAMGIIIMLGIMVNDTILKVDTINKKYIKENKALTDSLSESGRVRLKPILMTTLTTILALLPILFRDGIGAELQKPLLVSVVGGLFIGTITSLYFVPICYTWFTRKQR